jgi:hypothetical protein
MWPLRTPASEQRAAVGRKSTVGCDPVPAPPAGFDPATVGRITRIDHGRITHAQVTMPTGLTYANRRLYSISWSVASFLGIAQAGPVVQVNRSAFR